jgi:hypothetical protein
MARVFFTPNVQRHLACPPAEVAALIRGQSNFDINQMTVRKAGAHFWMSTR